MPPPEESQHPLRRIWAALNPSRASLSTGQTLDAKLDPTSVSLTVGYRF